MYMPDSSSHVFRSFCILLGFLAVTNPAFSQLSLVSSTPANGATGVATLLTLTLEFNAPLDTTARFEEPEGFFLGVEIFPSDSVGEPGGEIVLSPDFTTVTVPNLPLTPDTKFVLFLSGARSVSGAALDRPYALTFTTGSSLPAASVSGSVSFAGDNAGGTAVGLFTELPFGPGNGDNGDDDSGVDPEAVFVIPLNADNYTINFVPAGSYFILGFKDINFDGTFDFLEDAFGGYDGNGDNIADQITIGEGESLADIDFTINVPAAVTARQNYPAALAVAQSQIADAVLSGLSANSISPEGESSGWNYIFYSAVEDSVFVVGRIGNLYFISAGPSNDSNGDDGPPLNIPLPDNWIDSDVAADSAEANGGSDFRNTYPDAVINVFAGVLIFPSAGEASLTEIAMNRYGAIRSVPGNFAKANDFNFVNNAADTLGLWVFFYSSQEAGRENVYLFDITTGAPVQMGPGGAPTSARTNLDAANAAAGAWSADAALVLLIAHDSPVPAGESSGWSFIYYSTALDTSEVFIMVGGGVAGQEPFTHSLPSKTPLPLEWIDSPQAVATAETNGGSQYRASNQNVFVNAVLARALIPGQLDRAVWKFDYLSSNAAALTIFVDAITGVIVTGVESPGANQVPRGYVLSQNYPNPFNPVTTIAFRLPERADVKLVVYDLMGNEVATLVNGKLAAGEHRVDFDAGKLASGMYLYRLQTAQFSQTKKLILLK